MTLLDYFCGSFIAGQAVQILVNLGVSSTILQFLCACGVWIWLRSRVEEIRRQSV